MSRPGLFISFEGIDGAGKSSHIEGLAAAFRAQGRTVTVSREPGGTPLAENLRTMVLNDPMDALTESLLIFAARRDLQTDTPWNTYTRVGLPPTPIAMPGKASLLAAVQPEPTRALYFVAKGDGSSHFSASLDEHNRAVNRYQRGQQ